jgi:uncharacterized membrane protein
MSVYDTLKVLHIFAVIALVGPLILTPRWLYLYRQDIGKKVLHELHTLTGISGWIVLLSGTIMLWLQNGEMLSFPWMQFSLVLFVIIQLFDHFWADKREEALENDSKSNANVLKVWLIVKLGLYTLITSLMILQP